MSKLTLDFIGIDGWHSKVAQWRRCLFHSASIKSRHLGCLLRLSGLTHVSFQLRAELRVWLELYGSKFIKT